MRLLVLSDLHLEFGGFEVPKTGFDAVALAGDTDRKLRGVRWAARAFSDVPVLYVVGNHEYYSASMPRLVGKLRSEALSLGGHVLILERDTTIIDGVTFLGCTLWTDFRLFGDGTAGMDESRRSMTDYRKIRIDPGYSRLRPEYLAARHRRDVEWLAAELDRAQGATVVITHHAPSRRSIDPTMASDPISASYASDLDELVEQGGPRLWIHGHTHYPVDYRLGLTRVLSNPRGYAGEEHPGFDPGLVIEIPV